MAVPSAMGKLLRLDPGGADCQSVVQLFAASWMKPHIQITIRDVYVLNMPITTPRFEAYCKKIAEKRGNANVQLRFHGCGISESCLHRMNVGAEMIEICSDVHCIMCGICKYACAALLLLCCAYL